MSDDQAFAVTLATSDVVRAHLEAICGLYAEVFSVPPFAWPPGEAARHRSMMQRFLADSSFGVALALAGNDDVLVGFVYGIALGNNTNWWEGFESPVPEEVTREWPGRSFAVIDLAVRREWRRRRIGRRLMDVLLESRSEDRATLAVQPQTDSGAFYAAIGGWSVVGRQYVPDAGYVHDRFDIYVKDLKSNSASS